MSESRSRGWCVTVNNPTEEDELAAFSCADICKYCVFGREVGESGTPHLQGYVYFDTLKSLNQVSMLFPRGHIEKQRGTCEQAAEYCKKDGDFFESGDIPMSDTDKGECGKQSIAERWELARSGRFTELPPEQIKAYEYCHAKYTEVHDRDDLENIWIFGPSGCGKSRYVREHYPSFYNKGMNKWWDGYEHEDTVVLDDMDPKHGEYLGYFLKIWADHYAFNGEVKGGMLKCRPKRVIVTSQYPLEIVFPDAVTQEALKRRFKQLTWSHLFQQFL